MTNASGNTVEGNAIGTDVTDAAALPNGGSGVLISASTNNTIGGTAPGTGNIIAFNTGTGVKIVDVTGAGHVNASGDAILSNAIFGNGTLGIDLGGDGVTLNSTANRNGSPNELVNDPVLTSAIASDTSSTIAGMLQAAASATYTVQFFASATEDPSTYGQGQTYLGSTTVTTDTFGNSAFNVTLPPPGSPAAKMSRNDDGRQRRHLGVRAGLTVDRPGVFQFSAPTYTIREDARDGDDHGHPVGRVNRCRIREIHHVRRHRDRRYRLHPGFRHPQLRRRPNDTDFLGADPRRSDSRRE